MQSNREINEVIDLQGIEISKQTIRAQNLIPNKNKTVKTMFKMPSASFDLINKFSKIDGIDTVREAITAITDLAKNNDKCNKLKMMPFQGESIRKSVNITEESKKILSAIAKKHNVSRDIAFYSAIINFAISVAYKEISNKDKIKYARVLIDMANRMLDIYDSDEAKEARSKLWASDDNDFYNPNVFQCCGELLSYIEQLYEFPDSLEDFIKKKEIDDESK